MLKTYNCAHVFCGIGGGSIGFQDATEEYKGLQGKFKNILAIDNDPNVCENYEILTGEKATCMDLFSHEQYIDFHGHEPPEDWQEVKPEDILRAANFEYPHVIFLSPPCKGFSGLLPEKSAKSKKYQALNQLVLRGLFLMLEAFRDDFPGFILLENVPRIQSRGAMLLHQIETLLKSYGYEIADKKIHDCGEIGGLGQRRKRFIMASRHPDKISNYVYKPFTQRVKAIGEIIGPLPMPDDIAGGPLHRLPRLQWKTWVRLALIPAGGDWRDLEKITPEQYRLEYVPRGGGPFGVQDWEQTGATVIGNASIAGSNAAAVADPRLKPRENRHPGVYKVSKWEEEGSCVTGSRFGSGALAISDPRVACGYNNKRKVLEWDNPATTVTGTADIQSGAQSISDPRTGFKKGTHQAIYRVCAWEEPGKTVTGAMRPNNGAITIADPRGAKWRNGWKLTGAVGRVNDWDKPTDTVIGHSGPRGNGAANVADPRLKCNPRSGAYGVQSWDEPGKTIIGSADVHAGTTALADPRIPWDTESGTWIIIAEDGTWHRPLTTYELAMLQGFPTHLKDGRPFQLTGKSDARWREWIGNAVPPPSAKEMARTVLRSLLLHEAKGFELSLTGIWVKKSRKENEVYA